MRKSMLIVIAYIIGIIWGLNQEELGLVPFILILFMTFALLFNRMNEKIKKYIKLIFLLLLFVLLGFINVKLQYSIFNSAFSDGYTNVSGKIVRQLAYGEYYNKYLLKTEQGSKLLLYIHNTIDLREGDSITAYGKIKTPSKARNNVTFDYQKYLYSQKISASLFVYNDKDYECLSHNENIISFLRNSILNTLKDNLSEDTFGVILRHANW